MRFALCLAGLSLFSCKPAERQGPRASANGVVIVSDGSEPRRELHYALVKGSKSTLELALDLTVTAGTMGGPVPTVVVTIDTEVEGVLPTGHMNLKMTIADATARGRPDSQMPAASDAAQLDAIKGIVIVATLAPDGKLANAHVDDAEKQVPAAQAAQVDSLVTSLQQVTMPLPNVPLGVGASWNSPRTFAPAGLQMSALTTVTLTNIEAETLRFTSTSVLSGADQTVNMAGVALRVEHIAGTGTGHGTIRLDKLAIDGELKATFNAEMSAQNERTPMQATTTQTLTSR